MIKMVLVFAFVFCLLYFIIPQYRKLTGKQKWDYVKLLSYSALCAVLSIGVLILFVILF
jgi:hypothetical protein